MMNFTSRCPSIINRMQLRKCIALLGEEYNSLPYHIYLYKDRLELEIEMHEAPNMLEDSYNTILGNEVAVPIGICLDDIQMIKIFPFNLDDIEIDVIKCKIIWYVFHEIRHAWQNSTHIYTEDNIDLNPENIKEYYEHESERDANSFADKMYSSNVEHILRILEVNRGIMIDSKSFYRHK
ncbi:hypothetical protein [Paenibacillus lautus]|uniref:hypothetical protein n=1 Tax=Paenibacillus lautus TaxID=1401 RepID=UPI001C11DBF7|nr:hypothetical protein [Paenibacillus lautus]MBU5345804.1 hypothetical protein [Paenibacillus lautus]